MPAPFRLAAIAALLAILAGCAGAPKLPPDLQGPLYTQTRMFGAENGVALCFTPDDVPGAAWAPGRKVTVAGLNPKAVTIEDEKGDTWYLYPEKGSYWSVANVGEWMPKLFAQKPPAIPPAVKADLDAGKPRKGMTKDEVALVAGWPTQVGVGRPTLNMNAKSILAEDTWRYRKQWKTESTHAVAFKEGKLAEE